MGILDRRSGLIHRLLFVVATLFLIGISYTVRYFSRVHPVPQFQIALKHDTVELGAGKAGETMRGAVKISNAGNAPLHFQTEASCACTELNPRTGQIEPGRSILLQVGLRLSEEGTERVARVAIHSNDPQMLEIAFAVHASCPMVLNVVPRSVDFGQVMVGSSPRFSITIAHPNPGVRLTRDQIALKTATPHVTATLKGSASGRIELAVSLRENAPLGLLRDDLVLKLRGDDRTVTVPILADVVTLLRTAPRNLFLKREGNAVPNSSIGTVLVWLGNGGPLGPASQIDAPSNLVVTDISAPGSRGRRYRVRLTQGGPESPRSEVVFHFREAADPAKVTVIRQ